MKKKVVEMPKKKRSPSNGSVLMRKIKNILFLLAITSCLCIVTSYVTEKKCAEKSYKANMETLPCGLPLEMYYINRIESGVYVTASYYGMCILDINIDDERENAEVYVAFYPDRCEFYGDPSYHRYSCNINEKGNLVESSDTKFILTFDKDDHSINFKIIDEDSFKDAKKDLVQTPFSCILMGDMIAEEV